jgi:CRISPR-associated protein Csb1
MSEPPTVTSEMIDAWADDPNGPVALHLKQKLLPVEGKGGVVFPPTYADIGYNIDTLDDGTKVVTIDSVGSQANRLEPIFKRAPYSVLVPQIEIELSLKEDDGEKYTEKRSLLDLPHRSADAVVNSCPTLAPVMAKAFRALRYHGDAGPLCRLAPTSLVFGVWDSRGGSAEKRPRLVRSIIRAWNVQPLGAAAQFNSVWKSLSPEQQNELEKEAKEKKVRLSEKGFADAPATFRKVSQSAANQMREFRDGSPNPERRVLGGVITRDPIVRDVTVNLVALRLIEGRNDQETSSIRRYLLALALIAATSEIDLYLREGCNLRFAAEENWTSVPRRGEPTEIDLSSPRMAGILLDYAKAAAAFFKPDWPPAEKLVYKFDLNAAKKLLAKKTEDEQLTGN